MGSDCSSCNGNNAKRSKALLNTTADHIEPALKKRRPVTNPSDTDTASMEEQEVAFRYAIENGDENLLMLFVANYPHFEFDDIIFDNGDTALQVAIRKEAYDLISYLLTTGVSVKYLHDIG